MLHVHSYKYYFPIFTLQSDFSDSEYIQVDIQDMFLRNATRLGRIGGIRCRILPPASKRLMSDFSAMREAFADQFEGSSGRKSATRTAKSSTTQSSDRKASYSAPSSSSAPQSSQNAPLSKKAVPAAKTDSLGGVFGTSMQDFSPSEKEHATLDWSESFHGLGVAPFSKEAQTVLAGKIPDADIEITPDGLLYLPEIKYRRILNRAFGAGAWGMAPRSETLISKGKYAGGLLTREYGLVVHGRLVSVARGEQQFFAENGVPTATEGCKSNALMRCCKDLGIASELWDPRFIKTFKKKKCEHIFVEHIPTHKKKMIWKRRDTDVEYPFKR